MFLGGRRKAENPEELHTDSNASSRTRDHHTSGTFLVVQINVIHILYILRIVILELYVSLHDVTPCVNGQKNEGWNRMMGSMHFWDKGFL